MKVLYNNDANMDKNKNKIKPNMSNGNSNQHSNSCRNGNHLSNKQDGGIAGTTSPRLPILEKQ